MKWYKLITEYQKYRWYLFAYFAIVFAVGAVHVVLDKNVKIPALIFVGSLVVFFIFWLIAHFDYKKHF